MVGGRAASQCVLNADGISTSLRPLGIVFAVQIR